MNWQKLESTVGKFLRENFHYVKKLEPSPSDIKGEHHPDFIVMNEDGYSSFIECKCGSTEYIKLKNIRQLDTMRKYDPRNKFSGFVLYDVDKERCFLRTLEGHSVAENKSVEEALKYFIDGRNRR